MTAKGQKSKFKQRHCPQGWSLRSTARSLVLAWGLNVTTVPMTVDILARAADLAVRNKLAIWDCIILATAAQAGCQLLLSEDMQDGFAWGGLVVANAVQCNPVFARLRYDS